MAVCMKDNRNTFTFHLVLANPSASLRTALANSAPGGAEVGRLVSVFKSWIFFVQDCSRSMDNAAISILFFDGMCSDFFRLEFYFQIDTQRAGGGICTALVTLGITRREIFLRIGIGQVLVDHPEVPADEGKIDAFYKAGIFP